MTVAADTQRASRDRALRDMHLHDGGDAATAFDKGWDARGNQTVELHRITCVYPNGRQTRDHFASLPEAEISERAASVAGATTCLHTIDVPTKAGQLANWLNDYCAEQVSA